MKKSILLSCLFIIALLFPSAGHAEQSNQLTQDQEKDLYTTQMDSIELADGEDNDTNDEQETPTETEDGETKEAEEETEFVLLPIFIILTVVIGIFVYNFTKNREN